MNKIEIKQGRMTLLPCAPDVCQECAVKHEPWQAHNNQSRTESFRNVQDKRDQQHIQPKHI